MKPEDAIDYHIKIAWQAVVNKYNQIASGYGITHAMGYVLVSINQESGISVSQIASILGVKTTSLSRLLNSLEEMGFIVRKVDANDKRQVNVFLTDIGKEKQKIAKQVVREFNEYLDGHISASEKQVLIQTIQKINTLASNYEANTH